MKLFRHGPAGHEKPGILQGDQRYDVATFGEDYNEAFFENDGLERLAEFVAANAGNLPVVAATERLGPPVARPSKIICIGLNYTDHAREMGLTPPTEPVIFLKATTAMAGPFDDIVIPKNSVKTDWEVELALVIGKRASYVKEADAADYIAGYLLHNDVSEREFQMERGGTWTKGKSCDTFAPLGPFLATPDEVGDVNNLRLWLTVNGEQMQDGHTANLIFDIPFIIAYVSQFMTLLPGDIISTGSPAGVGSGLKPPTYLKPGDVLELGIDNLGSSRQVLKAYAG
ncbi:fumarylacetoacetate hydrolase family protein [Hymenobacter sp. BT683]|uniref:Fumarylacetoacetate hydrolase family protein n=1 Tax=Hymenobacter jeongseonensis TaxID=2791027 RepID=A0ABS0IDL9_9BACT|nr:fumarylacetoacetate hydrolase family protein [Hymenobacter jeongseonensis]MBF9236446.1 fumarylacetoacetate hydrolase family protein [Hymenobacter jeongseonensis]